MGSNLLKAWWLLPLHISNKMHPCDTPINTDAYLHLQGTFFSFLELQQRWFWNKVRCKTINSRGTTWWGDLRITKLQTPLWFFLGFFPLPCSGCGSCVYIVAVKDYMKHACSNAAWARAAFGVSGRAHGRAWIWTFPQINGFLSCPLRSHTGSCGQLGHCSGSQSSCFRHRQKSPLSHSWAVSMSEAGWVWASKDRERTSCSPTPTLPFKQE